MSTTWLPKENPRQSKKSKAKEKENGDQSVGGERKLT